MLNCLNELVSLVEKRDTQAGHGIVAIEPNQVQKHVQRSVQTPKIQQLHLSPASLRAGGATWLIDEGYEVG